MDKNNESYLDGLLETFGQEPPYETDRRRKAAAKAKAKRAETSKADKMLDSLEKEFDLDDIDNSYLDDINIDEDMLYNDKTEKEEKASADLYTDEDNTLDEERIAESENAEDTEVTEETGNEDTFEDDNMSENDEKEEAADGETAGEIEAYDEDDIAGEIEVNDTADEITADEAPDDTEVTGELIGELSDGEFEEESDNEIQSDGQEIDGDVFSEENIQTEETENPFDEVGEPEISFDEPEIPIVNKKSGKEGKEKKQSWFGKVFHKLFDNIPLTQAELDAIPTPEQEEEIRKEKEEEAARKKEEKKAAADAAKKKKAEEAKKKAADNKAKKQAKEAAKKAAKKEAELKRLRAEALEKPEGKINKAGAIIIFLFFMVAAAVVIVGTNVFSYDMSIANAKYKFGNRKYNEAYEDIRGVDVKEKDLEIRDKIYTVMYVNKQLNSYNNFYAMDEYASALDSLIKGLERYDKYIALATQLGIKSDLNYVRKQIMAELQNTYGVSERDALMLMEISDKQEYSEQIYKIVSSVNKKPPVETEKKEYVP